MRPRIPMSGLLMLFSSLGACAPSGGNIPLPASSERLATLQQHIRQRIAAEDDVQVGVALVDLATNEQLSVGGDIVMHAASTMKVPVLLEAFREADAGGLALDDSVVVSNEFTSIADGSRYALSAADDSDSTLYAMVGQKTTVRELLRLMIVRSSNLATNNLLSLIPASRVRATMAAIGAPDMNVLRGVEDIPAFRRGMNNTTTARALATVLAAIARCSAASRVSCDAMVNILAGQEFNDMIPAGLPPGTRVAHKTGWITGIQHDGAIVYPPGRPPYVLVILTRGFPERDTALRLGADISRMVWETLTSQ